MSYYQFEWKANRNFCVTAKHCCDFECDEAKTEEDGDGKFLKFALKTNDVIRPGDFRGTFELVGYFNTQNNAEKAWDKFMEKNYNYFMFVWNRQGECVNGYY